MSLASLIGDDPTFAGQVRPSRTEAAATHVPPAIENLQRDVSASLAEQDALYAQIYIGALTAAACAGNPDQLALAAHGLRELMEKYPRRGGEDTIPPSERLGPRTDALGELWRGTREVSHALGDAWSGTIDPALAAFLGAVDAHLQWASTRQPKDIAMRAKIEALGDVSPAQVERAIRTWRRLEDYFTDVSHHKRTTKERFAQQQEALERFLLRLHRPERRTFELLRAIDGLIAEGKANGVTTALVDRVAALLAQRHDVHYRHFFEHLQSPAWIQPLRSAGFFNDPPAPIDHPGNRVSFPWWPESDYLARVAEQAPKLVAEILQALPAAPNPLVHYDVVTAALALPLEHASAIARREAQWIRTQDWLYPSLPIEYAKLVARLARGGKPKPALDLASAMFEVRPPTAAPSMAVPRPFGPQPTARVEPWEYAQALAIVLPAVVEADSQGMVELLVRQLRTYVGALFGSDADLSDDYSYVWRRDLGEGDVSDAHDLREALVSALRDALARAMAREPTKVATLVTQVESARWSIFRRLVLHALSDAPMDAALVVRAKLVDPGLRTARAVQRERRRLLQTWFGKLSGDAQQEILEIIAVGPEPALLEAIGKARLGRPATADEGAVLRDHWTLDQLTPIADALPPVWRRTYDGLVATYGPAQAPPPDFRHAVWTGSRSPKTADELVAMDRETVVGFLTSWTPPGNDPSGESLDGLGNALSAAVALDPARFATYAPLLRDQRATIVRSVLDGFEQAVRENHAFDWGPVLELCAWALAQPHDAGDLAAPFNPLRDPHWGSTRSTIVRLVELGCEARPCSIPFDLRKRAWELISHLADDPDPTGDDPASVQDAVTHGINSVRGRAIEATVQYALWVARGLRDADPGQAITFGRIPEVADLLEAHLDTSRERSLGVRAMFGLALPQLAALDERWLADHITALFDVPANLDHLRRATWEAYCVYSAPYDNVFALLRQRYAAALERLGDPPLTRGAPDPRERFVEHLMVFVIRGRITRNDADHLLDRFYTVASPALRRHAIEFIGRLLEEAGRTAPTDVVERLRALWAWRLDVARAAGDRTAYREELSAFGWWFRADAFDTGWALDQVHAVLDAVGAIGPARFVVERLAAIAPKRANDALRALRAIASAEPDELRLSTSGAIEQVVRAGLADATTRALAFEVGDELLALGYMSVRSIIEEAQR